MAQEIIPCRIKDAVDNLISESGYNKTPFLIFDEIEIEERSTLIDSLSRKYFPKFKICISYKTVNNKRLSMKIFNKFKFGAEVASYDEFVSACDDRTSDNLVIFDGPLKKVEELELIFRSDISTIIHLDNIHEAKLAIEIIKLEGKPRNVKFGVRLSHSYLNSESRFGFNNVELQELLSLNDIESLDLSGIHIHTGSNLSSIETFCNTYDKYHEFIEMILSKKESWLDIGGGFPANSKRDDNIYICSKMIKDYFIFLKGKINLNKVLILLEPGRLLTEDSGYLITKVHHEKKRDDGCIITCDAGLNYVSSIRSWNHRVECLKNSELIKTVSIYGSNCFESDLLLKNFEYHDINEQYLIIRGCGGYDVPSTNFWLRKKYNIYSLTDSLDIYQHKFSVTLFHGRLR